jgi:hypothetical protein
MTNYIAHTQIGNKKDRVHGICVHFRETKEAKVFTVKGIGSSFVIFEGTQQIHTLKTLTQCKAYLLEATQ